MEIAPGIHSIPQPARASAGTYAPNVYLVAGERAALIDSGWGKKRSIKTTIEYLESLAPLNLSYIVVTHPHPDHLGGAIAIREKTGARVMIHSLAVDQANKKDVPVDTALNDGDGLDLGDIHLEIIHTPGHTLNSICIYVPERKALFTGDNILGIGTTVINVRQGDMARYIDSLRKLLKREIKLICPGHGPLVTEPRKKIEELISHRQERERQILSNLDKGRSSIDELAAEIYPEVTRRLLRLAKSQVKAHLAKLVSEGKVVVAGKNRYKPSG